MLTFLPQDGITVQAGTPMTVTGETPPRIAGVERLHFHFICP
jgi:hypothetical protein